MLVTDAKLRSPSPRPRNAHLFVLLVIPRIFGRRYNVEARVAWRGVRERHPCRAEHVCMPRRAIQPRNENTMCVCTSTQAHSVTNNGCVLQQPCVWGTSALVCGRKLGKMMARFPCDLWPAAQVRLARKTIRK